MLRNLLLLFLLFFTILLRAVNSAPTAISLSQNTINENSPANTLVGAMTTTDIDVGDYFTYALVPGLGSTDNASFYVSGNKIKSKVVINYEVKNTYSIRVLTNDQHGGLFEQVLAIAVLDVNEAPINTDATVNISENLSNLTNVILSTATDVDAGQTLTYSIVSGNTGSAFGIDAVSGQISVANATAIDFETNPFFSLVVRATDNGAGFLFDDANVTINLSDLNDTPVLTIPGSQSVYEFTNLNITPLSFTDVDLITDSFSFSILSNHGLFSLNSVSGLNFVSGDGVNDHLMGFYGSFADMNAAISSIVYKSYDDYVGVDVLMIGLRDYGHNSNGVQAVDKNISITVKPIAVSFTKQTIGATVCQTRENLFFVNTDGTNPMTYQWQHNGNDMLGETNDSLLISNATAADAGTYKCVVANPAGTYNSSVVNLLVNANPKIAFSSNEVCVGGTTVFNNSTAIDYDNIDSYLWQFNDLNSTSNATTPSRVFSNDGLFNVSLIVQSNLGCIDTLTQVVAVNPYPQTNFTIADICFVDTLKPINTTTIHSGTISYVWNFGDGSSSTQKNPTHNYVSTDSYILTLNSTSNKGCSTSGTQAITVNPSPIANFVVSDVCDSTIAKFQGVSSVSSGSLTHYWRFGDGDTNFNEVNPSHLYSGAQVYQVHLKVVSDKFCSDSVVKDIKVFPNPMLDIDVKDALCFGSRSGIIVGESSKGMAPYFYSLSGGNFTLDPVFKFLGAGNYSLLVLDNRNCGTLKMVRVNEPDLLTYTIQNINDVKCAGALTGSYTVVPKGGTAPYSFLVNKTNLDTNIAKYNYSDTGYFPNLKAKVYPNFLYDFNGCKTRFNVTVSQPAPIAFTVQQENVSCKGLADGQITINAAGGVAPYTYSIDGGLHNQSAKLFRDLLVNDYLVSVKDTNGCGVSFNVNILEPIQVLDVQAQVDQNVKCYGGNTGAVSFLSTGGAGVVQYSLGNSNSFSASAVLSNLFNGNYKVYARDENACIDSVNFVVIEPAAALSIQNVAVSNVKCFGNKDALIDVSATGGTGTLKYTLSNYYQNTNHFSHLYAGAFQVKVKDANSCLDSQLVTITQPTPLRINSLNIVGVNCSNDALGIVDISALGGAAPYVFNIGLSPQTSGYFTSVAGGDHIASVTDSNGCVADTAVHIPFTNDVPKAQFFPFVAGKVITFNNTSQNVSNYDWDFGDATKSILKNPIHQFTSNGIYYVKLKVSNQCNVDSIVKMVNIGYVGIEEVGASSVLLYPNPCGDHLSLSIISPNAKNELSTIEIFDLLGNKVVSKQFSFYEGNTLANISTEAMSSGKYLLRITNNSTSIIQSFEVIHQ